MKFTGAQDASGRDATVLPEVGVLCGHQSIDEGLGDVAVGDHHPVLLREDADHVAALVQHLGDGLRHAQGEEREEAVGIPGEHGPGHGKGDCPEGRERHEGEQQPPDPTAGWRGGGSRVGSHGSRIAVE
jgi:hypothetical protein